jgi:hypothetical protein
VPSGGSGAEPVLTPAPATVLKIFLARQQASMQSCSHSAQEKISGVVIQLGLSLALARLVHAVARDPYLQ